MVLAQDLGRIVRMRGHFLFGHARDQAPLDRAVVAEPGGEVVEEDRQLARSLHRILFAARDVSVAQAHDLGPGLVGELGAGGVELVHQALDFLVAQRHRRDLHVAAIGHGEFVGVRVARRHPDRHRVLQRARAGGGLGELPELAVVLVIALPQPLQGRDQLAHLLSGGPGVEPRRDAFIFEAVSAARDAEVDPPVRDDVGHGGLSGQLDRMPEGRDHGAGAEPHVPGPPREIDEVQQRVGRDGEAHPMVFAGPDRMHAALVGDAAQLDHLVVELLLGLRRIDPLHVDEEREFHGVSPDTRATRPWVWLPK